MKFDCCRRWLFLYLIIFSTCTLLTRARRGSSSSSSRSSSSSSRSRPSPSFSRPSPSISRPSPSFSRPSPSISRPSPSFSRPSPSIARPLPSSPQNIPRPLPPPHSPKPEIRQPPYNPNYKPGVGQPAGAPPPYSPNGPAIPSAPMAPPPPYGANSPGTAFGKPPPVVQPPPYPGPAVRPPGYFDQAPSPRPNVHSKQPGVSYPVQPGYGLGHTPPGKRPNPVQPNYPGNFHQSNRPYTVRPANYNPYPGVVKPYPQQTLGSNVWQPHYGVPAPAYMNYGGIPAGTNALSKPHKKKGFLGSLMSVGKSKSMPKQKNKYLGNHPSPYGVGHDSMGPKHSSSASMYAIFPYMAAKRVRKIKKPKFRLMPFYVRGRYHGYDHDLDSEGLEKFDIFDDDYVGKCQKPIKKKHTEVECNSTFVNVRCVARCQEGYRFSPHTEEVSRKCLHIFGVWREEKNFPDCKPVCEKECQNGGKCIRPGVCKCPPHFRGDRCQFHFLECDVRSFTKGEETAWLCHHSKNGTKCKIRCKEPAQFESPPADVYRCTPDGVWSPNTLPHCVVNSENQDANSTSVR